VKTKTLVTCLHVALGLCAVSTAHSANNISGMNLSGRGFNWVGGANLTNASITFIAPTDGSYGAAIVTNGDYAASNTTITLNTYFDAGGTSVANQGTNRILINGNATGQTTLVVNNNGGPGAQTDSNGNGRNDALEGISVVQVAGSSTAGAFLLKGDYVAVGPYQYRLYAYQPGQSNAGQRLVDGSGNSFWDYRLQNGSSSQPTPSPTPNPTPSTPQPTTDGTASVRPVVVPQVPSYLSASTAMLSYGMRNLGTLHDRLGDIQQGHDSSAGNAVEMYARTFGGNYEYSSNRSADQYGYDFDQNDRGVQIGGTWLKTGNDTSTFRLGMYGSTGTSRISPKAVDGSSAMRMNASSIAATATYTHSSGFYLDGVVARSYYNTSVDTAYRGYDMANMKAHAWTYSLEAGYPFVFANNVRLAPQTQVIYQSLRTNAFGDADGLNVTPEDTGAWTGRVGANLSKTFVTDGGQRWTPWLRTNYLLSSNSQSTVTVTSEEWGVSGSLVTGNVGQAWQLGAGLTGALTRNVAVYGSADYQGSVGSAGQQGWSANLGLRWRF
jgi:autotransporter family porin